MEMGKIRKKWLPAFKKDRQTNKTPTGLTARAEVVDTKKERDEGAQC